jgi:hypothetical protein
MRKMRKARDLAESLAVDLAELDDLLQEASVDILRRVPLDEAVVPAARRDPAVVRFARRNARRARVCSVPLALGLVLTVFALIRLPAASTAWTQEITLDSGVSTGQFSCQPLQLTYGGATADGANTKYTYVLSGGGTNPITCKEVVYAQLPVCSLFNPALASAGGSVKSESHPGVLNTAWSYTPQQPSGATPGQVRWTATNPSPGLFSALNGTFSFELAGTPTPTTATAIAQVLLTGTATPAAAGSVMAPCPQAAPAGLSRIAAPAPAAVSGNTGNSTPPAPGVTPSPSPVPTSTPTATPTPKVASSVTPVGSLIRATPTPTRSGE